MIEVVVYGIGYTIKEVIEAESISVYDALRVVSERNGRNIEEFTAENVTYLSGGKNVFPDTVLYNGDSLSVLEILCGG